MKKLDWDEVTSRRHSTYGGACTEYRTELYFFKKSLFVILLSCIIVIERMFSHPEQGL